MQQPNLANSLNNMQLKQFLANNKLNGKKRPNNLKDFNMLMQQFEKIGSSGSHIFDQKQNVISELTTLSMASKSNPQNTLVSKIGTNCTISAPQTPKDMIHGTVFSKADVARVKTAVNKDKKKPQTKSKSVSFQQPSFIKQKQVLDYIKANNMMPPDQLQHELLKSGYNLD